MIIGYLIMVEYILFLKLLIEGLGVSELPLQRLYFDLVVLREALQVLINFVASGVNLLDLLNIRFLMKLVLLDFLFQVQDYLLGGKGAVFHDVGMSCLLVCSWNIILNFESYLQLSNPSLSEHSILHCFISHTVNHPHFFLADEEPPKMLDILSHLQLADAP